MTTTETTTESKTEMRFIIGDSKKAIKFTTIINHLKQFTSNILIHLKSEGFYIQCLDDSHCCLFECELDPSWFEEYSFEYAKTIGISLSTFYKVLYARQESQSIELVIDEENEDIVFVNFIKGTNGSFDKYFELSLINIEADCMNITPPETLVDLTIETKTFCDMINQFMIFDDILLITFTEEKIELTASGSDGKMRTEINIDDVKEYQIAEKIELKQSYSLRYINMMCHFNKLSSQLYMGFSDAMPMLMKYDLGENSHASFHLAPKITDDQDE
jgi:proliferating cell nuclear antigen PCNA